MFLCFVPARVSCEQTWFSSWIVSKCSSFFYLGSNLTYLELCSISYSIFGKHSFKIDLGEKQDTQICRHQVRVESAESWSRPLQIQDTDAITPNLSQRLLPPPGSNPWVGRESPTSDCLPQRHLGNWVRLWRRKPALEAAELRFPGSDMWSHTSTVKLAGKPSLSDSVVVVSRTKWTTYSRMHRAKLRLSCCWSQ